MKLAHGIRTWGEMIKFSHSVFALPFAALAMVLAGRTLPGGRPTWWQMGLIFAAMVAARSFAMTFNRIVDAGIDARNPRTAGRPLVTGAINRGMATVMLVVCAAGFAGACAGFRIYGNPWPLRLAGPVLAMLAFYSYCKRFTVLAHFVLGGAIAFGPVAAWIAVNPATLGAAAAVLFGAVAFWIAGFDILYSCQDIDVDRRENLHSIPSRWGARTALVCSRLCHAATIILLIALGRMIGAGPAYWAGCGFAGLLLTIEQSLVRSDDFSRVNLAFFTVNGCVSVVFGAAGIADSLLRQGL